MEYNVEEVVRFLSRQIDPTQYSWTIPSDNMSTLQVAHWCGADEHVNDAMERVVDEAKRRRTNAKDV